MGGSLCHTCSLGFKACDVSTGEIVYVTAGHGTKGTASSYAGSTVAGADLQSRAGRHRHLLPGEQHRVHCQTSPICANNIMDTAVCALSLIDQKPACASHP
jgi:curli biogenesis system outer membrane secretion channel CsgG